MLSFRNLKADEIEVRPTDTKYGNVTLLLYKDARTDRRILDETVGPENWQCEFYCVNGVTFCRVGIKCDGEWIWKSDCGSESNIEKEKGLASDAFKRACFKWGVGSSLYSTPKIKLKAPDEWYYNDKFTMTFKVKTFKAEGEEIKALEIVDKFGKSVYKFPPAKGKEVEPEPDYADATEKALEKLKDYCAEKKEDAEVERSVLVDFYQYYSKKIEFDGFVPRSIDKLWNMWVNSPNRKTNGKYQS